MSICNYSESAADRLEREINNSKGGTEEMRSICQRIQGIEDSLQQRESEASSIATRAKEAVGYCAKCLDELKGLREGIEKKIKNTPTTAVIKTQVRDAYGNTVTKNKTIPINEGVIASLNAKLEMCDAQEKRIHGVMQHYGALAAEAEQIRFEFHSAANEVGRCHSDAYEVLKRFDSSLWDVERCLQRANRAAWDCLSVRMRSGQTSQVFVPPIPYK